MRLVTHREGHTTCASSPCVFHQFLATPRLPCAAPAGSSPPLRAGRYLRSHPLRSYRSGAHFSFCVYQIGFRASGYV